VDVKALLDWKKLLALFLLGPCTRSSSTPFKSSTDKKPRFVALFFNPPTFPRQWEFAAGVAAGALAADWKVEKVCALFPMEFEEDDGSELEKRKWPLISIR
jgi:hypothetical protein